MQKSAVDFRHLLAVSDDYTVAGLLVHGCATDYPYDMVTAQLAETFPAQTPRLEPVSPAMPPLRAFTVNGLVYWYAVCFGGAMLSQITHLACVLGSRVSILIGTCGGLDPAAATGDLIVPTHAQGDESTTRAYRRDTGEDRHEHHADPQLTGRLLKVLKRGHRVGTGPTVTCQAILGETSDDIEGWSAAGYHGVEMEAATLLATSAHFGVPAAAVLMIADNLAAGQTLLDHGYRLGRERRHAILRSVYGAAVPELTNRSRRANMGGDWAGRLPDLLTPWGLAGLRVGAELTGLGDRSRTWRIDAAGGQYAAKLTFDGPAFVEPGLRIAAALDQAGIPTGAPVPAVDGQLCRSVGGPGRVWTLALLEFMPGEPLDLGDPLAAEAAGDLLGQVHRALGAMPAAPRPAGKLLDFYNQQADAVGGAAGAALKQALVDIHAFNTRTPLDFGILYGDPAPEILRDPDTGTLALIDWGTPSFGPLLHDLVAWQAFLTVGQPPDRAMRTRRRFHDAYQARYPIDQGQFAGQGLFAALQKAISAAFVPEPPDDPPPPI
ncbi:phosphorylase family protein [Catenulispora pinisilvae]|uniref:phosphorylase family protein n=1 Tax=Catenulispora pinisilvae TaxID=2705253 RepID=UPI0018926DC2|nr:phosphotransferase [Catenulispora pinisilvae]